ncbi:MAG: hypothetical protein ACTSUE_06185 [Promethearchaeota archaeon]
MIPDWFFEEGGTPLDLPQTLWRFFEFGIFIILVVFSIYFLWLYLRSRKNNKIQAPFNLGYTFFFSLQVFNQVFYINSAFSDALNSYLNYDIELYALDNFVYTLNFQLAYMFLFFNLSFFCILFPFEKNIKNSKKFPLSIILLLSIISCAVIIIFGNIFPDIATSGKPALTAIIGIIHPIGALLIILAFVVSLIGALVLYFGLAKNTTGDLKRKSLATGIGLLIWFLSVIVGNGMSEILVDALGPYGELIGPILFYIGTFLLAYGFYRKN